jgi:hypothetical protein
MLLNPDEIRPYLPERYTVTVRTLSNPDVDTFLQLQAIAENWASF